MRPRIKDVARLAGVSTATVSHVLNSTRFVSPETRARVLTAVTQLGYSEHAVARSLRRGRTGLLSLIVSDIENPFFTRLARAVGDAAFERGYQLVLGDTGESAERERWLLESFRKQQVDGLLLAPTRASHNHIGLLRELTIPVVLVNRYLEGLDCLHVASDNRLGGRLAVEHLVGLGHSRIALVRGYAEATTTTRERVDGIWRALADHGLDLAEELIAEGDFNVEGGRAALAELMSRDIHYTAILALNNFMAIGVIHGFRERSIRCPEDMSVVTFGDLGLSWTPSPLLTTVRQPIEDMAKRAVDLMLDQVEGHERGESVVLKPSLIVRETSAAPGSSASHSPHKGPVSAIL